MKKNINIGKLVINLGWYNDEQFELFKISIFGYYYGLLGILNIQIAKFIIYIGIDFDS